MATGNVDETPKCKITAMERVKAKPPRHTLADYKESIKSRYKDTFFQINSFIDSTTVALCVIPGIKKERIFCSKGGKHAEVAFIEDVELEKIHRSDGEVEIVMMISKSPCFNCREALEVFFEIFPCPINFVLRIANLYQGKYNTPLDVVISDLMTWLDYLRKQKIVENVQLEPISVTEELKDYKTSGFDVDKWSPVLDARKRKDDNIESIVTAVKHYEQQPVITAHCKTLNDVQRLDPLCKRLFYRSNRQPPTTATVAAIGQISVKAQSLTNRDKSKTCRPEFVTPGKDSGCCCTVREILFKKIATQIKDLPKCWTITELSLTMMLTHCPCSDCFRRISTLLFYKQNTILPTVHVTKKLTLRIANIHRETILVLERYIKSFEIRYGIFTKLEAIRVIYELPNVPPPTVKSEVEKKDDRDWTRIRAERMISDKQISMNISRVNHDKHSYMFDSFKKLSVT